VDRSGHARGGRGRALSRRPARASNAHSPMPPPPWSRRTGSWSSLPRQAGADIPGPSRAVSAALKDERRAEGFAGCNQFLRTYSAEIACGSRAGHGPEACRERMDEERAFLRVLESAPLYEVSGENLTLSDGGAVLARFDRVLPAEDDPG